MTPLDLARSGRDRVGEAVYLTRRRQTGGGYVVPWRDLQDAERELYREQADAALVAATLWCVRGVAA